MKDHSVQTGLIYSMEEKYLYSKYWHCLDSDGCREHWSKECQLIFYILYLKFTDQSMSLYSHIFTDLKKTKLLRMSTYVDNIKDIPCSSKDELSKLHEFGHVCKPSTDRLLQSVDNCDFLKS